MLKTGHVEGEIYRIIEIMLGPFLLNSSYFSSLVLSFYRHFSSLPVCDNKSRIPYRSESANLMSLSTT